MARSLLYGSRISSIGYSRQHSGRNPPETCRANHFLPDFALLAFPFFFGVFVGRANARPAFLIVSIAFWRFFAGLRSAAALVERRIASSASVTRDRAPVFGALLGPSRATA